jgi:hypothetical protein
VELIKLVYFIENMNLNHGLSDIKEWAKSRGLGALLYKMYYAPKASIRQTFRWGFINTYLTDRGKRQMELAVTQLKPLDTFTEHQELEIYFMTGKKYWYQTCFCIHSMKIHSKSNLKPIIYDDGTLQEKQKDEIKRLFSNSQIVSLESVEQRLDQALPISKFPMLRERRLQQPLLRKLTDFHAGSKGWKLFLDSDMLFFYPPTFLIEWLNSPQHPCYMVDVKNAYGYSDELIESLAGNKIPDLVNIGIFGLQSEDIDWEKLEFWLKTLLEKEGTHYNVTQCLSAMYLSGKSCLIAPAQDYIVLPDVHEAIKPKAVLHHYVADSKPSYFRYGWKHIAKGLNNEQK